MVLDKLFNPKTIAVIGASNEKGSVGYALMDNLINSRYSGVVYPVNIRRKSVHSIKAYRSVKDIGEKIDLALIATPAATVPTIVEECGQAGVSGLVVISAGFKETGTAGEKLEKIIVKTARQYGMRILGPNCLGFMNPTIHLNATFANKMALAGKIAFISQSGALGTAILDWSIKNNVGFRYFVSVGSMADIGFHDLIDYFGQDEKVESILIYMESLKEARKFMSAARAFARGKPIIVLKSGRTVEGAAAAKSHTGSLTGNDAVFSAAFERAGIIRVDTVVSLFHTAKSLAMQPRPSGKRLAVITNAGGPGIIATDALIYSGGELAKLEKKTIEKLNRILPPAWSGANPVDILGDADPARFRDALAIVSQDKNVDAILLILTPQSMTKPTAVAQEIVSAVKRMTGLKQKMVLASWMGGFEVTQGRRILEAGNIPVYRQPEDAIKSFMYIYKYIHNLETLYETPATIPHAFAPKIEANRKIISALASEGREILTEIEAKRFLANYGIPVPKSCLARTAKEAGELAGKVGFPLAMKIVSQDILHKTDVGGLLLGINSAREAAAGFRKIIKNVKTKAGAARLDGVLLEPMVKKRYELLIGSKKDSIFGPVIVFGLGGIAVEVFKDTKIGLPPLNMALSLRLIKETKIYQLLAGYRGLPRVDIAAIQFLLYKFAYLVADFPEIKEVDINPFAIDEKGGMVLDAKIILDKSVLGQNIKPYSHLVISPYPKEYISRFRLKNRQPVVIRPIKPEDEPLEAELFTTFSQETQRHRFFGEIKSITHQLLQRYTQIDYDREIALVAILKAGVREKMIGVARLISDPYRQTAEFAVVVGDPWQNQGLGKHFTDLILKIATERGIRKVYAKFLRDNKIMLKILKEKGFKIFPSGRLMVRAEKELAGD